MAEIAFTAEGYVMKDQDEIKPLKSWRPGYATIVLKDRDSEFRCRLAGIADLEALIALIFASGYKPYYWHFLEVTPSTVDQVFAEFERLMREDAHDKAR